MARSLIASAPEAMHPVTRQIILERRAADRRRHVRRALQARGPAPRSRPHLSRHRCAGAADHADRLYGRAGARRSGSAQQPARHLHEFRQPARTVRARASRRDAARRHAIRRDAPGARRARCLAGIHRPRHSMPIPVLRSARPACLSPRFAPLRHMRSRRRSRARRRRRAPLRHAAQRRTACGRRAPAGDDHDRQRLSAAGAHRHGARKARPPAGRCRRRIGDRAGDLGDAGRGVRTLRRRGAAAAVDRHASCWPTAGP